VRREPLHVEQPRDAIGAEDPYELHERHLRRVPPVLGVVEHRLAGEEAAEAHPVQPTNQPSVGVPGLHGMYDTGPVQLSVHSRDVVVDPAAVARRVAARRDDATEVLVDCDRVAVRHLDQGARDTELVEREVRATYR